MGILITGVAGFIGMHVAERLLARRETVVGIDNLNDYYDVRLKEARLQRLTGRPGFRFVRADLADAGQVAALHRAHPDIDRIVHLAAQPGVRYSLNHPHACLKANIDGHLNMLELARRPGATLRHFVYASSSSVYGANRQLPLSEDDRTDRPMSLYAASKRANELMTATYSHLFAIPATGLRFFTVYGPWGRPDMSPFVFARKILAGEELPVFANGQAQRDFTYIDDIAAGVVAALDHVPVAQGGDDPPHRIYNLGSHRPVALLDYIGAFETALGRKAKLKLLPAQPGDMAATWADIDKSRADLGFEPATAIPEGVPRFCSWYTAYHGTAARDRSGATRSQAGSQAGSRAG